MREEPGRHIGNTGRSAVAISTCLASAIVLTAGCQTTRKVSEPFTAETTAIEGRALCETADLRVGAMDYKLTDGAVTHIGLKCVGDTMSISWTEYASVVEDFCDATGSGLSLRKIKIEQEDGEDQSTVEFECR